MPPPPNFEITLAGKIKEVQSSRAGIFVLGDGLVNGYPHWLNTDGSHAMWFGKNGSAWLVGTKDCLGIRMGAISGPYGKDSYPNEIKQGWMYWDYDGTWHDAGPNDVIIKAIGRFSYKHSQNPFHYHKIMLNYVKLLLELLKIF